MEIRQQSVDDGKPVTGDYEQVGPPGRLAGGGPGFQRSNGRGPDGDDAPTGRACRRDLRRQAGRYGVPLAVHLVRARVRLGDGSEGVESDVQDERREADAAGGQTVEELGGEV